jgi:predicted nucleic-acid-binding protein
MIILEGEKRGSHEFKTFDKNIIDQYDHASTL